MESSFPSKGPDPGVPRTRRTRIVCISDTHNSTVKLPRGDILIHAGDLTNQGSFSELSRAVQWLEKADFEAKIVVAGNHDITLDREFYAQYGGYFHNQDPQDPAKCLSLLASNSSSITYLNHSAATIQLRDPNGPRTRFTVFGSPYSPRDGMWAFGYDRSGPVSDPPAQQQQQQQQQYQALSSSLPKGPYAADLWSCIPLNTDVLVTHTPPRGHCDEASALRRRSGLGCEDLRRALWRVRPRLHVCGHVHEARGAERVTWDIAGMGSLSVAYAEARVERWEDPCSPDTDTRAGSSGGGGKMSLVDLTGRGKGGCWVDSRGEKMATPRPLENGPEVREKSWQEKMRFWPDAHLTRDKSSLPDPLARNRRWAEQGGGGGGGGGVGGGGRAGERDEECWCTSNVFGEWCPCFRDLGSNSSSDGDGDGDCDGGNGNGGLGMGGKKKERESDDIDDGPRQEGPTSAGPGSGTLGLGGDPYRSARCDRPALLGRMGRRETCVVNCAIVQSSWPHVGGKRLGRPVVVDLDLPVWGEGGMEWTAARNY